MKKLLLFFIGILISISTYSQSGATCATALALPNASPSTGIDESQKQLTQFYWFKSENTEVGITLRNRVNATSNKANKMTLWGGSCGTLILIASDTLSSPSDSVLVINASVINDTTIYYLQIDRSITTGLVTYTIGITYKLSTPTCSSCNISITNTCDMICNGSFETFSPTFPPQHSTPALNYMNYACAWDNACAGGSTPDYLTSLSPIPTGTGSVHVPNNQFGSETAFQGGAYAGFFAQSPPISALPFWHEYIYQQLRCPLENGVTYRVRFYVSLADGSGKATNSIGAAFVDNITISSNAGNDGLLLDNTGTAPQVPQIMNTSFITDTSTWTLVAGTFVANGTEENIVIGDFGSTSIAVGTGVKAYYYLDSVSVVPVDSIYTTVSDADSTICDGQTVTIQTTVFGFTPLYYFWTSAPVDTSLIGQDSMSTITLMPHDTTIYYLQVVGACGCIHYDTIQINVIPLPAKPLIVGDSFACVTGTPIPYTITNYDSTLVYTITFLPIVTGGTASTINSTGTFTVTWSDNNGATIVVIVGDSTSECDSVAEFIVKSCCVYGDTTFVNDSASHIIAYYGASPISNQSFSINGTLTIDQNMAWAFCSIKLGADAVINILPGKILVITQKTELSACNQMWDKIKIQPGARLIMNANSIIEDAKTAIYSIAGGEYNLINARLNRNFKDIELTPYSGVHPGTIKQTNFTCQPILGAIGTLNSPYTGYRTRVGIEINGVQSVTIGVSTGLSFENLFKNMDIGILATRSSVKVYGNNFKDIDLGVFPYNSGVAAIKIIGNPLPPFPFTGYVVRSLTVGDGTAARMNTINNCVNGIVTEQNVNVNISFNDIKNTTFTGITIKNNKFFNTVSISKNNIINFTTGISCSQNNICTTTITLNLITRTPTVLSSTGIALSDINSNYASYTIFNNDINKVSTGINSKSVSKLVVDGNRITIKPLLFPFVVGRGVFLSNNILAKITSNIIKCIPATTTVTNIKGVFVQDSPNTTVKCNEVHNFGASIHFDGPANTFGTVFNNLMKNGTYGFWLSNGVALGNQGGPAPAGVASDNQWQGTFTKHTFASGALVTVGNNSKIFYRNTGAFIPSANSFAGSGIQMTPQFLTTVTNPISYCAYPIPFGGGHKAMVMVVKDSIYTTQQLKWLSKHGVYRELKADSTLIAGDTVLANFKNSFAVQNMGKLYDALQVAGENNSANFVTAKNSINALAITEPIEDYLKTVINMALEKQITNVDFSSTDLSTLRSIAAMCPYNEGTGVYIARSLLVPYDAIGTEYENSCETSGTREMSFINDEPVSIITDNKFLLFPNPNNGSMTLNYEISETDNASLLIYDITGREISNYKMNANNNSLIIKENELSNGIYLYKVIINGKTAKSDRLVIIK